MLSKVLGFRPALTGSGTVFPSQSALDNSESARTGVGSDLGRHNLRARYSLASTLHLPWAW